MCDDFMNWQDFRLLSNDFRLDKIYEYFGSKDNHFFIGKIKSKESVRRDNIRIHEIRCYDGVKKKATSEILLNPFTFKELEITSRYRVLDIQMKRGTEIIFLVELHSDLTEHSFLDIISKSVIIAKDFKFDYKRHMISKEKRKMKNIANQEIALK